MDCVAGHLLNVKQLKKQKRKSNNKERLHVYNCSLKKVNWPTLILFIQLFREATLVSSEPEIVSFSSLGVLSLYSGWP